MSTTLSGFDMIFKQHFGQQTWRVALCGNRFPIPVMTEPLHFGQPRPARTALHQNHLGQSIPRFWSIVEHNVFQFPPFLTATPPLWTPRVWSAVEHYAFRFSQTIPSLEISSAQLVSVFSNILDILDTVCAGPSDTDGATIKHPAVAGLPEFFCPLFCISIILTPYIH